MPATLTLEAAGRDARRIMRRGSIVAMVLKLANGHWGLFDAEEKRLTSAWFAKPEGALQAFRIQAYRAAYEAANGKPAPGVEFSRGRYRLDSFHGRVNQFTGPEMDKATERLEARTKESANA